jgi:hypothetical protein
LSAISPIVALSPSMPEMSRRPRSSDTRASLARLPLPARLNVPSNTTTECRSLAPVSVQVPLPSFHTRPAPESVPPKVASPLPTRRSVSAGSVTVPVPASVPIRISPCALVKSSAPSTVKSEFGVEASPASASIAPESTRVAPL